MGFALVHGSSGNWPWSYFVSTSFFCTLSGSFLQLHSFTFFFCFFFPILPLKQLITLSISEQAEHADMLTFCDKSKPIMHFGKISVITSSVSSITLQLAIRRFGFYFWDSGEHFVLCFCALAPPALFFLER